jgi:hypothetical protein
MDPTANLQPLKNKLRKFLNIFPSGPMRDRLVVERAAIGKMAFAAAR